MKILLSSLTTYLGGNKYTSHSSPTQYYHSSTEFNLASVTLFKTLQNYKIMSLFFFVFTILFVKSIFYKNVLNEAGVSFSGRALA